MSQTGTEHEGGPCRSISKFLPDAHRLTDETGKYYKPEAAAAPRDVLRGALAVTHLADLGSEGSSTSSERV